MIIVLLYTSSCTGKLIPEKEMPQIIADIYKADRYVDSKYMLVLGTDTTRVYEAVFNHYGYTTVDYINTIDHYLSRPAKLKVMFSGAKQIIADREKIVNTLIVTIQSRDSISATYRELFNNADSLMMLLPRERALRWMMEPLIYPRWSFLYNDSLKDLYETPEMDVWWLNNFKIDSTNLKFKFIDEKDSSTIRVPLKFHDANLERYCYPEQ